MRFHLFIYIFYFITDVIILFTREDGLYKNNLVNISYLGNFIWISLNGINIFMYFNIYYGYQSLYDKDYNEEDFRKYRECYDLFNRYTNSVNFDLKMNNDKYLFANCFSYLSEKGIYDNSMNIILEIDDYDLIIDDFLINLSHLRSDLRNIIKIFTKKAAKNNLYDYYNNNFAKFTCLILFFDLLGFSFDCVIVSEILRENEYLSFKDMEIFLDVILIIIDFIIYFYIFRENISYKTDSEIVRNDGYGSISYQNNVRLN